MACDDVTMACEYVTMPCDDGVRGCHVTICEYVTMAFEESMWRVACGDCCGVICWCVSVLVCVQDWDQPGACRCYCVDVCFSVSTYVSVPYRPSAMGDADSDGSA